MLKSNAKLKVKVEENKDDLVVHLGGEIDEDAVFQEIQEKLPKKLVIDMDQIKFINSCGLRNWVNWMKKVKSDTLVVFRKCPKAIVDQINILEGFGHKGIVIESFYVPYYCDSCDREENLLAVRGEMFHEETAETPEMNKIPFTIPCPECKKNIEMDIIPTKYFQFIRKRRK